MRQPEAEKKAKHRETTGQRKRSVRQGGAAVEESACCRADRLTETGGCRLLAELRAAGTARLRRDPVGQDRREDTADANMPLRKRSA